jgi:hydrogenase expression/formation protein HypE
MSEPQKTVSMQGAVCSVPLKHYDKIVMGHGSGGRMTQELIQQCFLPFLSNPALSAGNDYAELKIPNSTRITVSIDAHVVSPLIFPGGDIGRLAVCGTVNDISMSGAVPTVLTASFILEEGLSTIVLTQIVKSMAEAAVEAGVSIIACDTKVVERGKADGIFITTSGLGYISNDHHIGGANAKPGDIVIISGSLGDHGIAVLAARSDQAFETQIESDTSPLNGMIQQILALAPHTHVLRDPTRGGLATTLHEIAQQSQVNITIDEKAVLIKPEVHAICEILGFDPLYITNEGKLIVIVPEYEAQSALQSMKSHKYGKDARIIGRVNQAPENRVLLRTLTGATRILDLMAGEMLPRIC